MSSFASLKNNNSFEALKSAIEKLNNTENRDSDNFWQPTVDKAGNGFAIIRFLPTPEVDSSIDESATPWVKIFSHGFQGLGGWYIENCPTTIKRECPV